MRWRTFILGFSIMLVVSLATQYRPTEPSSPAATAVVEFSYAARRPDGTSAAMRAVKSKSQRVVAPLVVLDISNKVAGNSDYLVTVDDIARWEEHHGHIPMDAVVLARSDLPGSWRPDQRATAAGRFPGYSAEAVRFLVEARGVYGLGTDTPDKGRSLVLPYRRPLK